MQTEYKDRPDPVKPVPTELDRLAGFTVTALMELATKMPNMDQRAAATALLPHAESFAGESQVMQRLTEALRKFQG